MKCLRSMAASCALALSLAGLAGCQGGSKDEDESFRVPDSLLAPLERYHLTVNEYHPVRGGIMANDIIELRYPSSRIASFVAMKVFGQALDGYRLVTEAVGRPSGERVVIVGAKDMPEYNFLTRKEWWYYAVIQGDTIICEPLDIMLKRFDRVTNRSIAEIGITQRMAQMALDRISAGRIPLWLREAAASHLANERPILRAQIEQFRKELVGHSPSMDELESTLGAADDMALTRAAFFFSYRMLEKLLERVTMTEVTAFARRLGEGATLDEGSAEAFGMPYDELIASIRPADLYEGAGDVVQPDAAAEAHDGHPHE